MINKKKKIIKTFLLAIVLGTASFLGYKTEKVANNFLEKNKEKKVGQNIKENEINKKENVIVEKEDNCDYESVGCNGFF